MIVAALIFSAVLGAAFSSRPAPVAQELPEGPGKAAMVEVCGKCHDSIRAASVRLTADGWATLVSDMITRGAVATPEQREAIINYLSSHFLGEADKPVNMNMATNIDLESVVGLLRREAAALIAYRDKVGFFSGIDDLKNIPGVDFKKIEAAKDRITF